MENLEYRSYQIAPTVSDDGTAIEGYAVRFYDGTPATEGDLAGVGLPGVWERIQRGAVEFAPEVWAFSNHNQKEILGRTTAGTLSLTVDERGVKYRITPPDTASARDLKAQIKVGNIRGSSFGMNPQQTAKITKEKGRTIRTIEKLTLWEVSPVFNPVYPATSANLRSELDIFAATQAREEKLKEFLERITK